MRTETQQKTLAIAQKYGKLINLYPGPNESELQFYHIENKGILILQFWKNEGTACYADWFLGETFDDLENALKSE